MRVAVLLLSLALPAAAAAETPAALNEAFHQITALVEERAQTTVNDALCFGLTCEGMVGDGTAMLRLTWPGDTGPGMLRAEAFGFGPSEQGAFVATCEVMIGYVAGIGAEEAGGVLARLIVEMGSAQTVTGEYLGTFTTLVAGQGSTRPDCRAMRRP